MNSNVIASAIRDVAALACITALAIAHLVPGSTAVALIAPYLLARALLNRPPPGGGPPALGGGDAGSAELEEPQPITRRSRSMRGVLGAVARAVLRTLNPFADLEQLVDGAEQLRWRVGQLVAAAEVGAWRVVMAISAALRSARRVTLPSLPP